MPRTTVSFTVDDDLWPKLKLVGERITDRGERVAFLEKAQYDLAYSQFENLVHNHLRPAVQSIIDRRRSL